MGLIILFSVLVISLIIGLPIALGIGLSSVVYFIYASPAPFTTIPQLIANGLYSYNVIAIPFFILAAQIMNRGGVSDRLINFANKLVGPMRGGLAQVNILTSMLFAGMSGSAIADSAGIGTVLIPKMKEKGYSGAFSAAVTGASSTVGPIIPPSVPMIMYGILAETSISQLFLAGAIPGVIMGISMMVLSYYYSKKFNFPREEKSSLKELTKSFLRAIPALLTPVILLGGMWGGIFSPTEAAAVAVGYALLQGFISKELNLKGLLMSVKDATLYSSSIMLIVGMANLFGWIISIEQVPVIVSEYIFAITTNEIIILLLINLLLLFMGMFMEILAIILITVPVFLPLITQLGISPVHFGVIMVLNLMIGLLSPPFGLTLYVATDIAEVPYYDVVKRTLPYIICLLALLLLVTFWPGLVLFLPNLI